MTKHPIRFGFQSGQQNVTWERMRDVWGKIDAWGYDSLWAFDHFYPIFTPDPAGPCMENWTLLSALSQRTRRARIGALVNSNTYRNPCLTAKMAATLDHVSGGRLNLGLGAGWYELEHRSFGIDFKTVRGRLEALDESCQIIKDMFTQDRTTVEGKHYHVVDAVCNPKPLQKPHIPLMIGGRGEKSLLKIVAKHADMWNTMHANPAEMKRLIDVIERHGDTVGRNTDEIEKTIDDAAVLQGVQGARADDLRVRGEHGADHARAGARSNHDRRQGRMPRQNRAVRQGRRHALHLQLALADSRRGRVSGFRRRSDSAGPPAVRTGSA